eukprot:gene8048-13962_t
MQDQSQDTEWNDALRKHGIIPEKKEVEITQDQIEHLMDNVIKQRTEEKPLNILSLDELDEKEDDEDDRVLQQIRLQRMAELKEKQNSAKFGDIREISANEYVEQVTNAGEGIWINKFLVQLSRKFQATKFLKSVSTNCIKNYPDKNVPTIFIYCGGNLKGQFVGPHVFGGMDLNQDCLEWMLSQTGAVETTLTEDPRLKLARNSNSMTILTRDRRAVRDSDSESDDDDD